MLKHHIPLKTDHWDVQVPGFTEIDLVSHSGDSASGEFCYSLNVTDIGTGWTETRAVLGKSQEGVRAALETVRQVLPFPLRGIDSANGSEFVKDHLFRYGQARAIQLTRGKRYKKDDNAHIEQKNWTHVRRLLGYVRYDSEAARGEKDLKPFLLWRATQQTCNRLPRFYRLLQTVNLDLVVQCQLLI